MSDEEERVKFEAAMHVVFDEPPLERCGTGYRDQTIAFYYHGWMLRAEDVRK